MAEGGDVFVLDMGEPVRIDDLAQLMVRLSGFDVKGADNPDGDISIVYTGLRSGEKLYEELLIGANTRATEHPRIWRSDEPFLPSDELGRELEILKSAMNARDFDTMHAVLVRNVEGYSAAPVMRPSEEGVPTTWTPPPRTLH
jgi:FlaA1/EpsC-like NDP-sugar epimerase